MRSATHATLPLFPLNTVLFPGGPLRLRIFEPRYLDMVSRCMREDTGFGVALIVAGREAGGSAQTVEIGTLARIVDFEQLDDGLLGITARGERRFRIVHVHQESDGLNVCHVEWLRGRAARRSAAATRGARRAVAAGDRADRARLTAKSRRPTRMRPGSACGSRRSCRWRRSSGRSCWS